MVVQHLMFDHRVAFPLFPWSGAEFLGMSSSDSQHGVPLGWRSTTSLRRCWRSSARTGGAATAASAKSGAQL